MRVVEPLLKVASCPEEGVKVSSSRQGGYFYKFYAGRDSSTVYSFLRQGGIVPKSFFTTGRYSSTELFYAREG